MTIADYSGPLGYAGHNGVYWAEGIYRHSNATETMAARYGHLQIETGSDVSFPDKSDFIAAPEVTLDAIDYLANGNHIVALSGEAKASTIVQIFENGEVVGSVEVDANGHFSLNVTLTTSGQYNLSAVAIDYDTGRKGITTAPMTFEISTAADIVARMDAIARNDNLAAIILTDTSVLTVGNAYQMRVFLQYTDTLSKIEGDFSFRTTTAMSGQGGYDRQDELFNSEGVLTERLRFLSGNLVYDEEIRADGTRTLTTWKTDGSWDRQVIDNGRVLTYSRYNSDDALVYRQTNFADGSTEIDYFNPETEAMTNSTLYRTDGSRTAITYGITGKAWVEESSTFNSSGKQVLLERFEADGTKLFSRAWNADGGMYTHNYNSDGVETSYTLLEADGSRIEATFGIPAQSYSGRILSYDRSSVLMERTLLDASGNILSIETFGATGTLKVFTYNADFEMTGYTLYAADRSYEIVTFFDGSETQIEQRARYDIAGRPLERFFYDIDGNIYRHEYAGSTTVYAYDADTGLAIGSTTTAPDGSYVVTKFVGGHEELLISASKYTAEGRLYEIDSFDSDGTLIRTDIRNTDGSREIHKYDAETHLELSYTITYSDKSRDEANLAVTNKPYALQYASYDSAGKLTEMTRKYGDADHTISFYQKNYTNGSSEVHNYDLLGRTTNESFTHKDGSRDAFSFTYVDTSTASTVQQTHFSTDGTRQWVDMTRENGSHVQTSHADRVRLTSHDDVADKLVGYAAGSDTFVFHDRFGQDTICRFQTRPSTPNDHIEFDGAMVTDFAELRAIMTQQGSDTIITFSPDDVLVIKNVAMTVLTADDFSFV